MTKYIPEENAKVIRKLLTLCKESKPDVLFRVVDTESHVITTKNIEKLIDEIDGGDDELTINCFDNVDGNFYGWFSVLPYEEFDGIVFDNTANGFCESIIRKLCEEELDEKQI